MKGTVLVEIYRNLHRDQFSVRDPAIRRVIQHVDRVTLTDAQFRVSEAGRQRVLKYRQKNVHAVVRGTMTAATTSPPDSWSRIYYDPYTTPTFVWKDTREPVHHVRVVYIGPEGVFAPRDPS